MRIHNESSDDPGARGPGWRACFAGWGLAGVALALGLLLTGAPAWAWVLGGASWASVLAIAGLLAPLGALGCAGRAGRVGHLGPADQDSQGSGPRGHLATLEPTHGSRAEVPPNGVTAPAEPVSSAEDPAREAEQEALRYALSHDLRAPLRVIDGFTRIVKEDYGRHLDRLGQDHLDRVLAASARMNGMIDAVLAQAQLASGPLQRHTVALSELVSDVAAELSTLHNAVPPVEWVVQPGLHALADATLVRRVLENLLGNALKYSAKVAQPRVEFGCMPATNPPVFFVRDNGAGFDMQHADKLFGMFQRLHSAKEFEGTGVGLAGVRQIIRRHGGRVWAEAKPGQGACFYFTLTDRLDQGARLSG